MYDSTSWQANIVPVKTNVVTALHNRSLGLKGWNSRRGPLHHFIDRSIAKFPLGNEKFELPLQTKTTFITAFNRSSTVLASCHGDHNTHVLDVREKKLIRSLSGHERSPWCVTFHPASNHILATGSLNGEVRVWDIRGEGSESWTLEPIDENEQQDAIASLSFHPYDNVLAIAGGNEILFWDWNLPKPFASVKTSLSDEKVRLVRFDPWGHSIITGVANMEEEEEDEQAFDLPTLAGQPSRSWRSGISDFRPSARIRARHRNIGRDVAGSAEQQPTVAASFSESSERRRLNNRWQYRRGLRSERGRAREDGSLENDESLSVQPWAADSDGERTNLSATHQRILHAQVSVNEEIRQQYTRLQMLRQERQRLELRLRELQNSADQVRNSTPTVTVPGLDYPQSPVEVSDATRATQIGAPYTASIDSSLRERQRCVMNHMNTRNSALTLRDNPLQSRRPFTSGHVRSPGGTRVPDRAALDSDRRHSNRRYFSRLIPRSLTARVDSEYLQPRIAPYVSFPRLHYDVPLVVERRRQNSMERRRRISAELRQLRADFLRDVQTPNTATSNRRHDSSISAAVSTELRQLRADFLRDLRTPNTATSNRRHDTSISAADSSTVARDQPTSERSTDGIGTSQPYLDQSSTRDDGDSNAADLLTVSPESHVPGSDEIMEVQIPDAEMMVTFDEARPQPSNERFIDFSLPRANNEFAEQFQPSVPANIQIPNSVNHQEQDLRAPTLTSLSLMEPVLPNDYLFDLDSARGNQFEPSFYASRRLRPTRTSEHDSLPIPPPHLPSPFLTGNNWFEPESASSRQNVDSWLPTVPNDSSDTSTVSTTSFDPYGLLLPPYSSLHSVSPTPMGDGGDSIPASRPLPDFSFSTWSNLNDGPSSSLLESSTESYSSQSRGVDRSNEDTAGSLQTTQPTVTVNSRLSAAESISAAVDSLIQATDSLSEAADNLLREAATSASNLMRQDDSQSSSGTPSPQEADTPPPESPPSVENTGPSTSVMATYFSSETPQTPQQSVDPRFNFYRTPFVSQPSVPVLPQLQQPTARTSFSDTMTLPDSFRRSVSAVARNLSEHSSVAGEATSAASLSSAASWRRRTRLHHGMLGNWMGETSSRMADQLTYHSTRRTAHASTNRPNAEADETSHSTSSMWHGLPRIRGDSLWRNRTNSRSQFVPSRIQCRSQRQIRRNAMRISINRLISTVYAENSGHRAIVLNAEGATYRIQYWDFTRLALPEISRPDINVLVPHCKIYNDASVDISLDGRLLAVFVPASVGHPDNMMNVGVFSLDPVSFGQLLFKKSFGPNAVCLSISPLCNYVSVGIKNRQFLLNESRQNRFLMAQIFELSSENSSEMPLVKSIFHPAPEGQTRQSSINTIKWSPEIGGGLVYGTNSGDLRMCSIAPSETEGDGNVVSASSQVEMSYIISL